jgi:DNA replication protein DnaC
MEHKNQVEYELRKLRLPGILFNLDRRIREAEENNLGYGEFISLLIQDELCQRENNNLKKLLKTAKFGIEKTFESFDFKFNEKVISPAKVREFATCRFLDLRQNIVIAGPPGIGKTHIAKAIGHEACRRGNTVLFKKATQLLEELIKERLLYQENLWKKCVRFDLLILDDFGFRKLNTNETEQFYRLVDERLGNGSIILTSNRPAEDWLSIFPDPVIGGAMLDRLVSGSLKIIVEGDAKSYRKEGPFN